MKMLKMLKNPLSLFLTGTIILNTLTLSGCSQETTENDETKNAQTEKETDTDTDTVPENKNGILLADKTSAAPIYIDLNSEDYDGISLIADTVAKDIELLTGSKPEVIGIDDLSDIEYPDVSVIAGTLNDKLISNLGLNWDIKSSENNSESDEWERYQIQVAEQNGKVKIVVAGSDKRGTIYGLFHISQDLGGVSPWVYWADTKPAKKDELIFTKSELETVSKTPSVKYRGIFLNDESPSLSSFVSSCFGEYNYLFYANVFELVLRLKGNYLWPAMWNNSFSEDGTKKMFTARDLSNIDKLSTDERDALANARLADHYGVVMGLSHHEPMMRAGVEWQRLQDINAPAYEKPTLDNTPKNLWNYFLNRDNIYDFWVDGFNRNKDFEKLIPIGMRGEGDSELRNPDGTPFTLAQNIELLKNVITDQKEILKNAGHESDTQALVLYKEVEKYWYGDGKTAGINEMEELKDDIIVLCEDNNNFLRTLPMENERDRRWGLYYHLDYNGGPRTYMWINVTPLQRIWDNMTMAYDYMVNDLWIVNVGDLKPMELPTSYFLDLAYDFEKYGTKNPNSTAEYTENWVKQQFSGMDLTSEQVTDIASIVTDYADMNGRKRPETVFAGTFSTVNYNEAQRELAKAISIETRAEEYFKFFEGTDYADTYYQLVYYPAVGTAVVNKMWIFQGLNTLYERRGSVLANTYAELIAEELEKDKSMMEYYNYKMSGSYWRGMMNQVNHTGFKEWNHESATYPEPELVTPKDGAELIVDAQGIEQAVREGEIIMLDFENTEQQQYALTLSNGGKDEIKYEISKSDDWINIETGEGTFLTAKTLGVSVDWANINSDKSDKTGTITVTSGTQTVTVTVNAKYIDTSSYNELTFFPSNGIISMNSNSYSDIGSAADGTEWKMIENYGKCGATMKTFPTTASFEKAEDAPYLEYSVYVPKDGEYTLTVYVGASNNRYYSEVKMRYGVQVIGTEDKITLNDTLPNGYISGDSSSWSSSILSAGRTATTKHKLNAGVNKIRIYGVDAGLLLEKLVLSESELKRSFFGPEETYYEKKPISQQLLIWHEVS